MGGGMAWERKIHARMRKHAIDPINVQEWGTEKKEIAKRTEAGTNH